MIKKLGVSPYIRLGDYNDEKHGKEIDLYNMLNETDHMMNALCIKIKLVMPLVFL